VTPASTSGLRADVVGDDPAAVARALADAGERQRRHAALDHELGCGLQERGAGLGTAFGLRASGGMCRC
jgi:hypothetical protein